MTRVEASSIIDNSRNLENPITVIAGSLRKERVGNAVGEYSQGLREFLQINNTLAEYLGLSAEQVELLAQSTSREIEIASEYTSETILELNKRYKEKRSKRFSELKRRDNALWNKNGHNIREGVMLCVDLGIPREIYAPDTTIGRSLAGNTPKTYVPSLNRFVLTQSYLKKLFLHEQRQNPPDARVEWIDVHTQCGRVGQMLSNTGSTGNIIPTFSTYFEHADALYDEFNGDPDAVESGLEILKQYWTDHRPDTGTMPITDEGRLAAVLQKVAKRQAIKREVTVVPTEMPIKLVDKRDLNIYTGLDNIEVMTRQDVIQAGGYTDEILEQLVSEGKIFSLKHKAQEIFQLLDQNGLNRGSRTYEELQTEWIPVQEELMTITENLWQLYTSDNPESQPLKNAVSHFLHSIGHTSTIDPSPEVEESVQRRLIHDFFHITSYTYLLNTFEKGNAPGQHLEGHLEIGAPADEGARKHAALGSGVLDKADASTILTEHAVLLHSTPGKKGYPDPALIRIDTEQPSTNNMTYEETEKAMDVLRESLKLWPYMVVGDIVPFIVIRGKREGGISRLPLSILKSFDNMGICFERGDLPMFVPAVNSTGKVVLIPARDIIQTRLSVLDQNGGLKEFRNALAHVADNYSHDEVQRSFELGNKNPRS